MQVNKNLYFKARLGGDSVAVMGAFKSWFQPSVALAATAEYKFADRQPRYGLSVQVGLAGAGASGAPVPAPVEPLCRRQWTPCAGASGPPVPAPVDPLVPAPVDPLVPAPPHPLTPYAGTQRLLLACHHPLPPP
jgi:hypothetical protein